MRLINLTESLIKAWGLEISIRIFNLKYKYEAYIVPVSKKISEKRAITTLLIMFHRTLYRLSGRKSLILDTYY
jgi:hypothetical protein